jgi:small-conductance mechanosensitive channel
VPRSNRSPRLSTLVVVWLLGCLTALVATTSTPAWARPFSELPAAPKELDRSTPRRSMQAFLESTATGDFGRAIYLLDLRDVPKPAQDARGRELSRMLRYVLDHKARIDVAELSDDPVGREADGLLTERVAAVPLLGTQVPIRLTRVALSKTQAVWLVSRDTLRAVPELYEEYGPGWFGRRLPDWAHKQTVLSLPLWQWLGLVTLALAALFVGYVLGSLFASVAARLSRQTNARWDDYVVEGIRGPLRLFFAAAAFGIATSTLRLAAAAERVENKVVGTLLILSVAWLVMRVVRAVSRTIGEQLVQEQDDEVVRQGTLTQVAVARRVVNTLVFILASALALLQFEVVRRIGFSVLASAGIAGVVFGLAAQRVLGNVLAGIQLSIARPVRIGDRVLVEGQFGFVEELGLTFAVVKTWDDRRIVLPITYLLEKPFENWTRTDSQLVGVVMIYADYSAPVEALRAEFLRLVHADPGWDGDTASLAVVDTTDRTVVLRGTASGDAKTIFDLRCRVREQMVAFLQQLDGGAHLPKSRVELPRAERDDSRLSKS